MRTVWKFSLAGAFDPRNYDGTVTVELPDPEFLVVHVGPDPGGSPCVWVDLHTEATPNPETVTFQIVGTGHRVPKHAFHVGAYLDGPFVWHVYLLARGAAS